MVLNALPGNLFYSLGNTEALKVFDCGLTLGGLDFRQVTLYKPD